MINLHFDIRNPWHNEERFPWRDFYQGSWSITKNKTLEVCVDFYPFVLAHLDIKTHLSGSDHAGPEFSIGLLGFGLDIGLRDNRHWDYTNNKWMEYTNS